jgi:hypothetical protein
MVSLNEWMVGNRGDVENTEICFVSRGVTSPILANLGAVFCESRYDMPYTCNIWVRSFVSHGVTCPILATFGCGLL